MHPQLNKTVLNSIELVNLRGTNEDKIKWIYECFNNNFLTGMLLHEDNVKKNNIYLFTCLWIKILNNSSIVKVDTIFCLDQNW